MPKETIRTHIVQRFAVHDKYIATYRAWEDEHNKWARHVYQLMRIIMKAQRDAAAQRNPNQMDADLDEEPRMDENDADTVATVLDEFMEEYTSKVATEFESADLEMFDENGSALTTLQEGAEVDERGRVRRWFMSQFKRMEKPGMSSRIGLPPLHRAAPRGAFGLSPEGNQSLGQTWRAPSFDLPKQAAHDVLIRSAHNACFGFPAPSFKPEANRDQSGHPLNRSSTKDGKEEDEQDHPWRIYSTKCSCGYANCNCRSWKAWWDETHDMLAHVEHINIPVPPRPEDSPDSLTRFVRLCSKAEPPDSESSLPHAQPTLGSNSETGQNGWVYDRFSQTGVQTETRSEHAKVPNLQYRKQYVMTSARPQSSQENIAMQLSWNNVLYPGDDASTPGDSSYKTIPQTSNHTSIKLSWEEFVGNDPTLPSEYSSEIFRVLKDELEPASSLDQTILAKAINWRTRTRFVHWIASIHCGYNLSPQILFLSVNLMDRFLAKKDPPPCGSQWNVLAAACLWSAWKFEGSGSALIDAAHVLKYTEPGTVSKAQIIAAEWDLHRQLNHNLSFPGPLVFMRHALTRTRLTKELAYLARFFVEISLTLELMIPCRPSNVATAAVYLAQELMCISTWEDIAQGFGPNDGGDFTIRSQDGVDFHIHSVILRYASPVFDELMSSGSGEPLVTLTEEARTIRLMLVFVYFSHEQPVITDISSLEKALEVARKYELASMTASLRSLFWLENSPMHMRNDPVGSYELACIFGFEDIQKACYQHCIRRLDLSDNRIITEILPFCRHPRYVLPLVARLAKRRAVITETLHAIHTFPMNLVAPEWDTTHIIRETLASRLICGRCIEAYDDSTFSAVSWQIYWAHRASQVLLKRPMGECDHVFEVGFLCKPYDEEEDVTVICDDCFTHIHLKNHKTWENWAQIVRETLEKRLGNSL
ncbi:G2/mitotic-specific cyclin [Ceratobasidium sp. 392]|nr:G2/mitotic-specific cyclin [Ceratobasidium sp. 392]